MTALVSRASVGRVRPDAAALEIRAVQLHDPLVQPMLSDLSHEYHSRYRAHLSVAELRAEMEQYPAHEFAPPRGDLILLLTALEPPVDGAEDAATSRSRGRDAKVAIAGGAFRRRVEPELGPVERLADPRARTAAGTPAVPTAELKRIWTDAAHRSLGLGGIVLRELERRAAAQGYERIYLTTGPRQPEAVALYLRGGYRPLYDPSVDPEEIGPHPFEKRLTLT